ncbi:hypothetical protein B857_03953 [Solibacillus isronensis B3W22]|uniref:Uncharacterized protein n=1 Tax=Solibacillus isronensis B3W22 TaxID=1224748 RepID=K1KXH1_9BACL|nr:hypothetical protein B857_03953 [Solibacillus isronensis B3W22]
MEAAANDDPQNRNAGGHQGGPRPRERDGGQRRRESQPHNPGLSVSGVSDTQSESECSDHGELVRVVEETLMTSVVPEDRVPGIRRCHS